MIEIKEFPEALDLVPETEYEAPVILDRGRHHISRRDIDPDCLKVLYRLSGHGYTAYLVGGAVRDLMLGRRPADFDVGTNAHPNQIKKLFRNAFLIGRRFRLAHIRFQGGKIIEVSTFRRKPDEAELAAERDEAPLPGPEEAAEPEKAEGGAAEGPGRGRGRPPLKPISYGTPREDAFRRDLTINALFYDIATFSVIDYVGGLEDLAAGRVRIIGDPDVSCVEDPVRIWRVLRHASRLGFAIEDRTAEAVGRHASLLQACSGARLYEELSKDMKSASLRPFLQAARRFGLLSRVLGEVGELYQSSDEAFEKLAFLIGALDASIGGGGSPPPEVALALLLWPWAEPRLAEIQGDKPKVLYDAFRGAGATATVPKALLLEAVHTLVIVEHMLRALTDGKMRWALKERPRYPEASRITSLLVEGTFGDCDDPFARFGARPRPRPHRHRRRKKPVPPLPPPSD
jgi:poly(A) polymerase